MKYVPEWYGSQFEIGAIVINGDTDANGCDWILTKESGWFGSPAIKTARADKPAAHGLFRGNEYRGGRVVTLEGTLSALNVDALRNAQRQLAGICPDPAALYPLTVTEESGLALVALVALDGELLTAPIGALSVDFSVQLVAPDPRKFSISPRVQVVPLASPGSGGVRYPVGYPVSYGTPGAPGAVLLTNDGTAEADPVVTFAGPLTTPSLTRADTGDVVTYAGTLAATDSLTVDFGAGSVLLNGVNRRPLLVADNWFSVPPQSSISVAFRTTNLADTGDLTVSLADASY
ncbi:MAG TPA: hypothetical protein VFW65_32120 [Pseudonocardiaceae bacterium]|nr:hypothetical protein [Pseudonocardiaceae bacterium]